MLVFLQSCSAVATQFEPSCSPSGPPSSNGQVQGVAESGDEINCLLTLKLEITRESAPRLITFPAQGKTSVQASDVAEVLATSPRRARNTS